MKGKLNKLKIYWMCKLLKLILKSYNLPIFYKKYSFNFERKFLIFWIFLVDKYFKFKLIEKGDNSF